MATMGNAVEEPPGELHLAQHRDPGAAGGHEPGDGGRNPRRQHHQVGRGEVGLVVPPERQGEPDPLERRERLGELARPPPVGDRHPGALADGEPRGRGAASRQPDHEHLLPGEQQGHVLS
jgi:hypothetical protein